MDEEMKDYFNLFLEKFENINKRFDKMETEMDKRFKQLEERMDNIELTNETKIVPTLQLILENQTEVINQKSHIIMVEGKQEELKDRVDVIEYAVKQNQNDIKELKKRA